MKQTFREMTNVRDELLLEYSYLADGDSVAGGLCPACRGGGTGEGSLSVSRSGDAILWHCHRATCGFSGGSTSRSYGSTSGSGIRTKTPTTKGVVGRIYYMEADKVPVEVAKVLEEKYYFNPQQLRVLAWDEEEQRVVIPVMDESGELTGCVLRSESGAVPKALNYNEEDAVAIFRNYSSDSLIIVEDAYSALRASQYMNAAAILGTHLNHERVSTLRALKCKRNYLALDNDAYNKTIKFVTAFRNEFRMTPVMLKRDLKNLTPDELKEFFNDLT